MILIELPYIYQLSERLEPLALLKGTHNDRPTTFNDVALVLFQADHALSELLHNSVFSSKLMISRRSGEQLLQLIRDETVDGNFEREMMWYGLTSISSTYLRFKTIFQAEMASIPAFIIASKQAYDINILLKTGEKLFPEHLLSKVPEAAVDARDAGRALAFELNTACAFHTFRVLESVVRRYYAKASGGKAEPKNRNLGVYLRVLEDCGTPKILASLKQIKDLHRNPTIHPEISISNDEAVIIIGLSSSAIGAMLNELDTAESTELPVLAEKQGV